MSIPHPIPYQGSKRNLAQTILRYFPKDCTRLIEPFAGSAAVSLAAAYYGQAQTFILNDLNKPIMDLWTQIINHPDEIAAAYEHLWNEQLGSERTFYDWVRLDFNRTQRPDYLLFLLVRCVKAAIRYNAKGEFNQSPDNRRKGTRPATMRTSILAASQLFRDKVSLQSGDYQSVVGQADVSDVVYLDPPYQGVSSQRDQRYVEGLAFNRFIETLEALNAKHISFIVSYDGRTGAKQHGAPLPACLGLTQLEVNAGTSAQATLLGRSATTFESLYLSAALVARLDQQNIDSEKVPTTNLQRWPHEMVLFEAIR